MRVVIIGAGMIGVHIARELVEEKRDVVLVEKDPEVARIAGNDLDCLVINDDGSRPEVLRKAGTSKAAWFLALTGSDEVNILACGLVAAESKDVRTIARVENPFYTALSKQQRDAFGLDVIVDPAMETADAISRIIAEGFAEAVVPLHDGQLQLRTVPATGIADFIGKPLRAIKHQTGVDFLIAAVARKSGIIVPSGDTVIEESDKLYVLGTPQGLDSLIGPVAGLGNRLKRIVVIGATRTGRRLVDRLMAGYGERSKGVRRLIGRLFKDRPLITIVESNREAAKAMAKDCQGPDVLCGDPSESGILEQAGVGRADLVVCVTGSQTFNIISAQLAKHLGAAKSIAVTTNERYMALGPGMAVDAMVCDKSAVAAAVLEMIRRARIRTIHDFYEDDVEILELRIAKDSVASGRRLLDMSIPKRVLIGYVIRGKDIVVPKGDTVLQGGDTLGLVAHKQSITGIEAAFGGVDGN
jgi:trk system potassium uptake protein TrkA